MAARRNIVPTAEISIAATVVDPSSLLFPLFSPLVTVPFSLFISLPLPPAFFNVTRVRSRRKAKITHYAE